MSIAERLVSIRQRIPHTTRLIAVSKNHPAEAILEAYSVGQRLFGENKAQELVQKAPLLPSDIEWHFIGHLQRNKVRAIIPFVSLIHSVDSLRLLEEIDAEARRAGKVVSCLLQFHIAEEESKFGLDEDEASALLQSSAYAGMKNVRIAGVMGMATLTDDMDRVRREFIHLKEIFDWLKLNFFADESVFRELSMGMTSDMDIAIEEGSTLIRIGTAIFGDR
jgi:pyridoxal phosphate enzyme (YggS family)